MNNIVRSRPLLGTFVEIGTGNNEARTHEAVTTAFSAVQKIHVLLSFQEPDSELSRLNRSHGKYIALHPLSLRVLRLALAMTRCSENLFNCTIGGVLVERGVLPDHTGRLFAGCGTADDVEMIGQKVRLRRPVLVTLDGIAKGYAVDHAIRVMRRFGLSSGWVNAGGDMRVFGNITLPVQRREVNNHFAVIGRLQHAALATSRSGRDRDPRFPGQIVAAGAAGPADGIWSVLARSAWRADALTKVAALAPATSRERRIARLGGKLLIKPD